MRQAAGKLRRAHAQIEGGLRWTCARLRQYLHKHIVARLHATGASLRRTQLAPPQKYRRAIQHAQLNRAGQWLRRAGDLRQPARQIVALVRARAAQLQRGGAKTRRRQHQPRWIASRRVGRALAGQRNTAAHAQNQRCAGGDFCVAAVAPKHAVILHARRAAIQAHVGPGPAQVGRAVAVVTGGGLLGQERHLGRRVVVNGVNAVVAGWVAARKRVAEQCVANQAVKYYRVTWRRHHQHARAERHFGVQLQRLRFCQ